MAIWFELKVSMLSLLTIVFTALTTITIIEAQASENVNFDCGSTGFDADVEIVPEDGRARIQTRRGVFFAIPQSDGHYVNEENQLQFFPSQSPPVLWIGSEQFNCRLANNANSSNEKLNHNSGAIGGKEKHYKNTIGESLGGKVRDGPGTNFRKIGSLREGARISILSSTGVRFDGYDWFHIRYGKKSGYQWGGIMCAYSKMVKGVFTICKKKRANISKTKAQNSRKGWMAFAIGNNGVFGHGAANNRRQAQKFALQFCNQSSCRIEDVTQAQCHAMATTPGGFWFGSGENIKVAKKFAIGFCRSAGASCKIEYSFCR